MFATKIGYKKIPHNSSIFRNFSAWSQVGAATNWSFRKEKRMESIHDQGDTALPLRLHSLG
jgi:hypothetical protein